MAIEITMPRLSDTMETGTLLKWNVAEGQKVAAGDAVADVETDKATMEMQVYDDGTVAKILVPEGRTVEVGTPIAILAEEDEDPEAVAASAVDGVATAEETPSATATAPAAEAEPPLPPRETAIGAERARVSPVARRLADEHGIDLRMLQGSGPGGRIIKRDVLSAVDAGKETAAAVPPSAGALPVAVPVRPATVGGVEPRMIELSNVRQTIAKRLVESKTTIPHYQVTVTFNVDPLLELRRMLNEQLAPQEVKLSLNDFLIRGCALAIHQHPEFNASWAGDHIEIHAAINVGMAIALPPERGGGLLVATIRDADVKGLREISAEAGYLAERARTHGLSLDEMADTTFTISNLGMFGVDNFTAIINPPNSAILAVGAAQQLPVVREGQIVVGHEMAATLSLDHRVIDGAMAARYLQTLKQLIENPATVMV
ncbi:MAG: dihydrolipoamide acetyltransferase family protein [Planctomycetota bacterium]|jgi:pyruvate dehydrogenase E2 component (dihydrolipoamide acetyltransferase)